MSGLLLFMVLKDLLDGKKDAVGFFILVYVNQPVVAIYIYFGIDD